MAIENCPEPSASTASVVARLLMISEDEMFEQELLRVLMELGVDGLNLQTALRHGGYALADTLQLSILSRSCDEHGIELRVSAFFDSVIAGCSCADDPTPLDTVSEHCVLNVTLDKQRHDLRVEVVD
ncbi:MAG: hypothetical protein ACWA44_13755 [Thiotrichales bacterium]